jgi:hypothetical protein
MLYRPALDAAMWDTWLYYHQGVHYLYYLRNSVPGTPWDGISLATSSDGVHFREAGRVIDKRADASWLGTGSTWRAGNQFVLNFSEDYHGVQAIFFAVSDDLVHWRRLGDEYRCDPDPRWYDNTPGGRWDCIWAVPRSDGGFWGYLTARPWSQTPGIEYESVGKVASDDGLHWHAVAPPDIDWGAWPRMDVHEVGAVEEIGGRYYMMLCYDESKLGNRHGSYTLGARRGMYSFTGDTPEGPFKADLEAYRLLTSNAPGSRMAHFTRFYRLPDEMLINHHSISRSGVGWLAPLKRAVVDDAGHLSLGYWPGNDAVKGKVLPIDLSTSIPTWPKQASAGSSRTPSQLVLDEPNGGALVLLTNAFDLQQGIILEGDITITTPDKRWSGIGLYVEGHSEPGSGTALLFETRGITEIGLLKPAERGWGMDFLPDDCLQSGITADVKHRFRLLVRQYLCELYLDDRLVQCYSLPEAVTGRLGLVVESGRAVFEHIMAWGMNL